MLLFVFAYVLGVGTLDRFIDNRLMQGRNTFVREEAQAALGLSDGALTAALTRLARRKRLVSPHRGFYLILRPEDQTTGAPDPAQWIEPLMSFLALDYRVSLLRAASFHGSSHQAAMVFQIVVPRQLRPLEIGRHRVEFIFQAPAMFVAVNQSAHLDALKTSAGFAHVAGVELTLLDCARYFHKAGGINAIAQVVKDIGAKGQPRKLALLASNCESSCVRRLGYLMEHVGHMRQARALEPFAGKAKTSVLLDPSVKPLSSVLASVAERSSRWKLVLNVPVEVDF